MKTIRVILILFILFSICSCIVQYIPKTNETQELLVVEGLISDQPGINTIKLSKSVPLWNKQYSKPLKGSIVTISDDMGRLYTMKETRDGIYVTDSATFQGAVGREYTLHIQTTSEPVNFSYASLPMKMIPVPPIDSIYYEKQSFVQSIPLVEGCNIFLNTHDPSNNCRFFRWEYSETWEFHIPFNVPNNACWLSDNSKEILIKNASVLNEASIIRHPVISIANPVDRLSVKYSILVNQFSLSEDEYSYWERLRNTINETGGLYDLIPAAIPNNIYCIEEPERIVLGYFSVSSVSSKRLFIKNNFAGINTMYERCLKDTILTTRPDTIHGLGTSVWIIKNNSDKVPPANIFTTDKGCVDCRTRGTIIKPAFWDNNK
jgi:hypothetical protein